MAAATPVLTPAVGTARTRLLTVAPGHFVWDERVLRSVEAARRVHRCVLALDAGLYGSARPHEVARVQERLGGETEMVLLPPWPRVPGLARLTRRLYAHRIGEQARALRPDVVHIHESGILGLMVAARVRRLLPAARIIFDYHDWIPEEVAASVRYVRALYGPAMRAWLPALRRMARAVDAAVCISPGQAEWAQRELGIRRTLVVQNVREATTDAAFGRRGFRPQLVWAGHVMRIRRLEFVIDVLAQLWQAGTDVEFSVFGHLTEPTYVEELRAYARARGVVDRVSFLGPFQSDRDLADRVGPGAVGLTLAMEEKIPTGINRIASANKFFSYMTLGLPVLLDSAFENMLELSTGMGAASPFHDARSCAAAARTIWEVPGAWQRMSEGARAVAREESSDVAIHLLEGLYAEFARRGGIHDTDGGA